MRMSNISPHLRRRLTLPLVMIMAVMTLLLNFNLYDNQLQRWQQAELKLQQRLAQHIDHAITLQRRQLDTLIATC